MAGRYVYLVVGITSRVCSQQASDGRDELHSCPKVSASVRKDFCAVRLFRNPFHIESCLDILAFHNFLGAKSYKEPLSSSIFVANITSSINSLPIFIFCLLFLLLDLLPIIPLLTIFYPIAATFFIIAMEPNNGSTSSLASFQDATGGRLKDRVRRKPVPKYLPDPPRKHSSPSPPSPFRQLTALANANIHKDHPPLPDDWQQTIAKALDMERHVERPAAPTPDIESEVDVEAEGGYVTTLNPADPSEKVVEQPKAVPKTSSLRGRQTCRRADTDSTLDGPARSINLEASGYMASSGLPHSLSRKRSMPQMRRPPTPSPSPPKSRLEEVDDDDEQLFVAAHPPFRIVYPERSHSSSPDTLHRNAAVFPAFPDSAENISLDVTAVDSQEDVRDTADQSSLHSRRRTPASKSHETSVSVSSHHIDTRTVRTPSNDQRCLLARRIANFWRLLLHILRQIICAKPALPVNRVKYN